jgi:hypothetical protein
VGRRLAAQDRAEGSLASTEEALKDIYMKLRPGDPPSVANAKQLLKRIFFDPRRYDLSRVGRYKIQQKLGQTLDRAPELEVPRHCREGRRAGRWRI